MKKQPDLIIEEFMTKILSPDEITMDDIRRIESYRDQLIIYMNKNKKPKNIHSIIFRREQNDLVEEIKKIHVWLKATLNTPPL